MANKNGGKNFSGKSVTCFDVTYKSMKEWANDFGITDSTNYVKLTQLVKKVSPEEAITRVLDSIGKSKESKKEENVEVKEEQLTLIKEDPIKINNTVEKIVNHYSTDHEPGSSKKKLEEARIKYTKHNPISFPVNNTSDAINKLKEYQGIKHINLIDFENMVDETELLLGPINKEDTINIFFYNARIYSNQFFNTVIYTKNINLQVLIYEPEKQLVDHLITFYLGALQNEFPEKSYSIISRDYGFYPFGEVVGGLEVMPGKCDDEEKGKRFRYSVSKYILENQFLVNHDRISKGDIEYAFRDWFMKTGKVTKARVNTLIGRLIEFHILYEFIEENKILYKFDIGMVERVVNNQLS